MANAAPHWFERSLTHRDLDDLPEDDAHRYEVIDGELYVASFPSIAHQLVVARLWRILDRHVDERGLGEVFPSGTKVVLDEPTGVGPDLVYIAGEHLRGLQPDGFYGAPDLVVEVTSSKPSVDRVVKYRSYAAAGVPYYWIINPHGRTLEAFVLAGSTYVPEASHKASETFSPKLFPGLTIPLSKLWG